MKFMAGMQAARVTLGHFYSSQFFTTTAEVHVYGAETGKPEEQSCLHCNDESLLQHSLSS
jgi:hypothetical protein